MQQSDDLRGNRPDEPKNQEKTVTTTTLRLPVSLPGTETKRSASSKGFWRGFIEAMMAARMRQAMREIEHHRHLIPEHLLKSAGYQPTARDDGAMPFTR
jgi:hypothetical protein